MACTKHVVLFVPTSTQKVRWDWGSHGFRGLDPVYVIPNKPPLKRRLIKETLLKGMPQVHPRKILRIIAGRLAGG